MYVKEARMRNVGRSEPCRTLECPCTTRAPFRRSIACISVICYKRIIHRILPTRFGPRQRLGISRTAVQQAWVSADVALNFRAVRILEDSSTMTIPHAPAHIYRWNSSAHDAWFQSLTKVQQLPGPCLCVCQRTRPEADAHQREQPERCQDHPRVRQRLITAYSCTCAPLF